MASVRKLSNSRYWIACYRDMEGQQRHRSTKQTGKAAAQQVAFEYERLSRDGNAPTMAAIIKVGKDLMERLGQTLGDPTIEEEFLDYLALGDRSDSTKERYKQITDEFLAHLGKAKERKLSTLTAGQVTGGQEYQYQAEDDPLGLGPGRKGGTHRAQSCGTGG